MSGAGSTRSIAGTFSVPDFDFMAAAGVATARYAFVW